MLEQQLQSQPDITIPSSFKAWLVSLTAALFFFYELIQLNMFGAIHDELMRFLHLDASQYGLLSAIYLIANVIFLIPAGYLLDRYSTKKIILIALGLCILGTYQFSFVHSFASASIARFLTGIGSAFCFVGCIRLASRWFPQERMALATGSIVTIAMLGGFMAQTPMSMLVKDLGWQSALIWDAVGGIAIFIAILMIVEDAPQGYQAAHLSDEVHATAEDAMRTVYRNQNNWLAATYTSLINMPIVLLGAVWGIPYLMHVHQFTQEGAAFVTSMLFTGIIVGSPFIGWLSDTLRVRKPIMFVGATLMVALTILIALVPTHLPIVFVGLFFLLGFVSSAQVLSYPLVAETNPAALTATATSIISFVTQGGGAVYQVLYGYLLDHLGSNHLSHGIVHYAVSSYQSAFLMLPIAAVLALFCLFKMK